MTDKEKRELKDGVISIFKRFNILDHTATIGGLRDDILRYINSLQEEPVSEDNTLRKASEEYLKVLSETPYNNTPITNAQTIVRELITFLDNPSKYNPNHIEETGSEDLEEAAFDNAQKNYKEGFRGAAMQAFNEGANWQKEQMMAKAMAYAKKEAINAALCRIQAVAYKYHALDVNGDYCEQPFVDIYSELYELKNEE